MPSEVLLQLYILTIIPSLLARGVVELYVDLPVLPRLGPVFTMGSRFVGFVVDLCAEGVCKLLCTAVTFLTQKMSFSEVLTEVAVITGTDMRLINKYTSIKNTHKHTHTVHQESIEVKKELNPF